MAWRMFWKTGIVGSSDWSSYRSGARGLRDTLRLDERPTIAGCVYLGDWIAGGARRTFARGGREPQLLARAPAPGKNRGGPGASRRTAVRPGGEQTSFAPGASR